MRASYSFCYEVDNTSAIVFETHLEMIGKYSDELTKQRYFLICKNGFGSTDNIVRILQKRNFEQETRDKATKI